MLEFLVNNVAAGLQNVYTPIPTRVHFIFCLIATLLYLVQFYRRRSAYYLFIMAAIDITFITQYWTTRPVIIGLAIAEVVLIVLAVISSILYNKRIKLENAAAIEARIQEASAQKEAEEAAAKENKKFVDNAFDDEDVQ